MASAKQELEALWTAMFNEPPIVEAEPPLLAALIVRCCGPAPPYGDPIPRQSADEPQPPG